MLICTIHIITRNMTRFYFVSIVGPVTPFDITVLFFILLTLSYFAIMVANSWKLMSPSLSLSAWVIIRVTSASLSLSPMLAITCSSSGKLRRCSILYNMFLILYINYIFHILYCQLLFGIIMKRIKVPI